MLLFSDMLHKLQSVRAFVTFYRRCDDAAVPDSVEVSRKAPENYRHVVAATIMIVGNVKRLVSVANKMIDILESFEPLAFRDLLIAQYMFELFDLRDNASTLRTIASSVIRRGLARWQRDRDVYVMPRPCLWTL